MTQTRSYFKYVSQNILGQLGVSCYILADTFFIAQAAGADGITLLNLCLPLYNLIFAFGSMLGLGAATRFSILRSQEDPRVHRYFSNALLWACLLGLPFAAAGLACPDTLLRWMGGDAQIVALGVGYTRIFLLFAPFFMINYIVQAFVRNDGDPSLAMAATLSGSLFNIVFDYIFMFPMGLGLPGAALATAASPIVSVLICSRHFLKKESGIRLELRLPSAKLLFQSCQLGITGFVGEISSGVTTTVFNFLLLGLAGNLGVAAYGVVANFALVATAIFNGAAQGAQPLISGCYGRRDYAGARHLLRLGLATALVLSGLIFGGVLLFAEPMAALFNSEGSALLAQYAGRGLRIYFAGYLLAGLNITAAGYLSAVDRPAGAFVLSICRGVAAIVGCSVVLSVLFGMDGIWCAFGAAELITAVLTAVLLRSKARKTEGV